MQLQFLPILAAFLAVTQATPVPANKLEARNGEVRRGINDCGDSTFVQQVSNGSPSVADCQHLARNIAGDGSWTLYGGVQRTVATYGTCAFGATASESAYIGNQDIIDLINSSIQSFASGGRVGTKGDMVCEALTIGPGNVNWGIYHT